MFLTRQEIFLASTITTAVMVGAIGGLLAGAKILSQKGYFTLEEREPWMLPVSLSLLYSGAHLMNAGGKKIREDRIARGTGEMIAGLATVVGVLHKSSL